ncbi:MAG: CehA/McbA family metallohydrolase [Alphaproteobacteria bacterium]|nr:CehA/McbA family metallohydrolase [Alphaproteobacteria bacterium]
MLLLWLACATPEPADPIDLTTPLGPGEVRAGVVTDPDALFGGISAEGRVGDLKLYNDRARFIIQGLRPSSYYLQQPGALIDADVVRPEGQPGRDLVDEWAGMVGIARLHEVERIEILADGTATGRASVRVSGPESPMALATGALEYPDLVPDLGLYMRTDYVLDADSPLLAVVTTITATDDEATFAPGDLLIASLDASWKWTPGVGLDEPDATTLPWSGFIGQRNEAALGLFPAPGTAFELGAGASLLASLAEAAIGFGPTVTLQPGESTSYVRFYGVAPDLAALTDAWLALNEVATETLEGTVTAPDGPVAGAWVNVLVDEAPYTLAITDDEGRWSADVPTGSDHRIVASGLGPGMHRNIAEGAPDYGPYAAPEIRARALTAIAEGATPIPLAEGRGVAAEDDPEALAEPGWLALSVDDGLPFEARVSWAAGAPSRDRRLHPSAPNGLAAVGWAVDGTVRVPVEPGDYDVLAWRGLRYELDSAEVSVAAGETVSVDFTLPAAYDPEGWVVADPHSHAAPSNDGNCTMTDRLLVAAAVGLDLHFGTDHDHVADYRPLLGPLGLDGVLGSVVADEVSPVPRGHVNAWPLESVDEEPNGGAWLWWNELVDTLADQNRILRDRHGDIVLQMNHPTDNGVADMAGWSPGTFADPDKWVDDFEAVEALNSGDWEDYFAFYLDLINRGVLVTPVGVSDAHGPMSGHVGHSLTFLRTTDTSPAGLVAAMRARGTIASMGAFLEMSVPPGTLVTAGTSLEVRALSPSWIRTDRITLFKDGEPVEVVEGDTASFRLTSATDATYVVVAEGDSPMSPIWSRTPWAASSAILLDVDGDGWTPPLGGFE